MQVTNTQAILREKWSRLADRSSQITKYAAEHRRMEQLDQGVVWAEGLTERDRSYHYCR